MAASAWMEASREAVDERRKRQPPTRIQIHRLDPIAHRRNKLFERRRLGTAFDGGSRPDQKAPADCLTKISRGNGAAGVVERLLDPSRDFTIGGVDDLVTKPNRVFVDCDRSAQNVKAGAGAKLADKPDVKAAEGGVGKVAQAQVFRRRHGRIRQPVEIIGDREMFGDVALPRGHDAATGLDPGRHRASSQN